MRSILRHALPALALGFLLVAGCDKSTAPEPVISGSWSGSGGGMSVNLSLTQTGTSVAGNGSLSGSGGAVSLTATGTFTNPNFSLTLKSPGYEDVNFSGTLNGNSMTGIMNGSGFNQVGMTLTR
jgi:hypothetical protein